MGALPSLNLLTVNAMATGLICLCRVNTIHEGLLPMDTIENVNQLLIAKLKVSYVPCLIIVIAAQMGFQSN